MDSPFWGSYVFYADYDLLAFAWLVQGGLDVVALYHAIQALEKYLKGLAYSVDDPTGKIPPTDASKHWLKNHNLVQLAERCSKLFPRYGDTQVQATLKRYSEFDQWTRYPWVPQTLGNGFTTEEFPKICELLVSLRIDIPLVRDDYPLGMFIRGCNHGRPECAVNPNWAAKHYPALAAARRMIPQIEKMVRR